MLRQQTAWLPSAVQLKCMLRESNCTRIHEPARAFLRVHSASVYTSTALLFAFCRSTCCPPLVHTTFILLYAAGLTLRCKMANAIKVMLRLKIRIGAFGNYGAYTCHQSQLPAGRLFIFNLLCILLFIFD